MMTAGIKLCQDKLHYTQACILDNNEVDSLTIVSKVHYKDYIIFFILPELIKQLK